MPNDQHIGFLLPRAENPSVVVDTVELRQASDRGNAVCFSLSLL